MPRTSVRPNQPLPRYTLTRREAAAALSISLNHFERHVQPELKVVPSGQLILIPVSELERWVQRHARARRSRRFALIRPRPRVFATDTDEVAWSTAVEAAPWLGLERARTRRSSWTSCSSGSSPSSAVLPTPSAKGGVQREGD